MVFIVGMNLYIFFDMTAVLICVQNELVLRVSFARWQSVVTVVKCSWKSARRGHSRQPDERFAGCDVCVSNYLSRKAYAGTSESYTSNPSAFKSVKTDCLIQHISHVATSKMSEMSFALNKKLPETFKDTLDDCFNLERLLMISSPPPFSFFFFPKIQVNDKEYLDVHFSLSFANY